MDSVIKVVAIEVNDAKLIIVTLSHSPKIRLQATTACRISGKALRTCVANMYLWLGFIKVVLLRGRTKQIFISRPMMLSGRKRKAATRPATKDPPPKE